MEFLKKFDMMKFKLMTTEMIKNLKMLRSAESSLINPTKYKQLVGSLMYLLNTLPNICFAVKILSKFEISTRNHPLPPKI